MLRQHSSRAYGVHLLSDALVRPGDKGLGICYVKAGVYAESPQFNICGLLEDRRNIQNST